MSDTTATITWEMWNALTSRIAELERAAMLSRPLDSREPTALELGAEARRVERIVTAAQSQQSTPKDVPPVDRTARVLVSGARVPEDESHRELKVDGQQKDYVVLSAAERSKGFVRPYRDAYRHLKCGKITTMGRAIAETYARDPTFYTGDILRDLPRTFPHRRGRRVRMV